jgi:predicted metalloendopeptidase
VNTIIEGVKNGFQRELKTLPWLENNTRQWALAKAFGMEGYIGYTDFIRDPRKVDAIYGNVGIQIQYFFNGNSM